MDDLRFEWDRSKAEANRRKHGISFDEGKTIFSDPLEVIFADPDHSADEERSISVGRASSGESMLACSTEVDGIIRLTVLGKLRLKRLTLISDGIRAMGEEYDLSNGVRGRRAGRYAAGVTVTVHEDEDSTIQVQQSNLVELEPDVQIAFPDSESVNTAFRLLMETAEKARGLKKAS